MISHETLVKATVAGTLTVTMLSIPFFVDLQSDSGTDSPVTSIHNPTAPDIPSIRATPSSHASPSSHATPSVEGSSERVIKLRAPTLDEMRNDAAPEFEGIKLQTYGRTVRSAAERRSEAAKLRDLVKPPHSDDARCGAK